MVLWEAVKQLNHDVIGRAGRQGSVVKHFVHFLLVRWIVMREEVIVYDTVHNLGLSYETWSKHSDSYRLNIYLVL